MPVEFDRESPGKFDSRTFNRKNLNRWTGRSLLGVMFPYPGGPQGSFFRCAALGAKDCSDCPRVSLHATRYPLWNKTKTPLGRNTRF